MVTNAPDRLSMQVKLLLVVLGAVLCLIGVYRYFVN
jgi:hypothetical protein